MLGNAYFQLRAQVGTGLFSLLRLAAEAGAQEGTQVALRDLQSRLRETFLFAALGPPGSGKSTLLNTLFERDFCGGSEPAAAGRVATFQYSDEPREISPSPELVEIRRPHIFLRDFHVLEAPAGAPLEILLPLLEPADLILYVVSVTAGPPADWTFLSRLGRDLLKRLVFVVWQTDRVAVDEAAQVTKRLRQAMLKNLSQACPIFLGSNAESAARQKLMRWIEAEVIFAPARRARLRRIGEVGCAALREIVAKPRAQGHATDRASEHVHRLRDDLAEREEQTKRQAAGALWTLAQSFELLRRRGERLLAAHLRPVQLLWNKKPPANDFAREIETQARTAFREQLHDQLAALETGLQHSATEYLRQNRATSSGLPPVKPPEFPRARLETELLARDQPLDLSRILPDLFAGAVRQLRLPGMAALAAVAAAVGLALAGYTSRFPMLLAAGNVLFVLLLAFLLRENIVAAFGLRFTANRSALLAALEPELHSACERFYAALLPPLDTHAERLANEREQQQPLLARLRHVEATFARIEARLRAGLSGDESA